MEFILNLLKLHSVQKLLLIVVAFFAIALLLKQCEDNERLKLKNKNNVAALNSKVDAVINSKNELQHERAVLIANQDELSFLNEELYKELENEKSKPKFIEKVKVIYSEPDTIKIDNTIERYKDGLYGLKWDYEREDGSLYQFLKGETFFNQDSLGNISSNSTLLFKNDIQLNLITGLNYDEEDELYKIYVRPEKPVPNLKFDIEGAIIDDDLFLKGQSTDKSRFIIGPYIGIGLSTKSIREYDTFNSSIGIGFGVAISYPILEIDF